jgi:hypothetical protein
MRAQIALTIQIVVNNFPRIYSVLRKRFGDSSSADVSVGDCMQEQSISAPKKTHACD